MTTTTKTTTKRDPAFPLLKQNFSFFPRRNGSSVDKTENYLIRQYNVSRIIFKEQERVRPSVLSFFIELVFGKSQSVHVLLALSFSFQCRLFVALRSIGDTLVLLCFMCVRVGYIKT